MYETLFYPLHKLPFCLIILFRFKNIFCVFLSSLNCLFLSIHLVPFWCLISWNKKQEMFIGASHPIEVIDHPRLLIWATNMVLNDVGVWITDCLLLCVIVSNAKKLKTYYIHVHIKITANQFQLYHFNLSHFAIFSSTLNIDLSHVCLAKC